MSNKKSNSGKGCRVCGDIPGPEYSGQDYCGNHQSHKKAASKRNTSTATKSSLAKASLLLPGNFDEEAKEAMQEWLTMVEENGYENEIASKSNPVFLADEIKEWFYNTDGEAAGKARELLMDSDTSEEVVKLVNAKFEEFAKEYYDKITA